MNAAVDNAQPRQTPLEPSQALRRDLQIQRNAYRADPVPDFKQRRQDLMNLRRLVVENQQELVDAVNADYGSRSSFETRFAEIYLVLETIGSNLKHLKSWMKPQKRHIDVSFYPGARNRVIPQPLGVIGVIVPWNFPIQLSLSGVASIFAAGNRAMVKMSENSRHLARLLIQLSPRYFPEDKLKFYDETGTVGIEFSKLPFDHLLFTGSGQTGRAVMASAAQNLTPVTLELGGKSPALIAPDFPLDKAVERIMFGKMLNAGQICITTDYALVHENQVEEFVRLCQQWVKTHYPDIQSPDFTAIIDDRSFQRLEDFLDDAVNKGAHVIDLTNGQVADARSRKFPPHLILNPPADAKVVQREIFGPLMPVISYRDKQEAVDYINGHDRPLAFYPFSNDRKWLDEVIDNVMSGGVSVNDVLLHQAQHDLPFGGVGPSGMGHYHGREGFMTFSKLRPVFYQSRFSALKWFAPPHGAMHEKLISILTRLKS